MHPRFDRLAGRRSLCAPASGNRGRSRSIKRLAGAFLAIGVLVGGGDGGAGHSVGHFPSYYPDEIRIDVIEPVAAAKGLIGGTLHAYVGASPAFVGSVPDHVKPIRSLGSFLVLSFKPGSAQSAAADTRCETARDVLAALGAEKTAGFVFHPYPVTPYHADYLHHLDRVEAATSVGSGPAPTAAPKVAAKGRLAETIVKAKWGATAEPADIVLEEVAVDRLLADAVASFDGWSGLPWAKEGWFHAYRLLAPALSAAARQDADEAYARLTRGETIGLVERVNLERHLVAALTGGCARMIAGYAPREEYIDERYPEGIENVAYDSLGGLSSAVFVRTVKLKEYPWNGKLQLGVRDRPAAAWNPVAGFTDGTGRLIWSAIGDPAMIPFPFNASWMPNRVQATVEKVEGQSGGIRVPADALRPQPGTGALAPVGAGTFSSAKVTYEVLTSPFEDGTKMEAADAIYPFVFAFRWGTKPNAPDDTFEPRLAATFAAMEERLAGLKVVRVEEAKHAIAEGMEVIQKVPVVEVYLRNVPRDEGEVSALAPPWSTVPWHLLALMEEAAIRGYAAFSEEEAARRGVPWLDLVRDRALQAKLLDLVAQFERESYRPEPLKDLVTAEEARTRWQSLRAFAEANGHFLVANGPYRLKKWSPDSTVLEAVREMTYPLGFGTFDRFVNPPTGVIDTVARDADTIIVGVKAEMTVKAGRGHIMVSEPLTRTTMRGTFGLLVVSRYLLIDPDGNVLEVDKMQWRDDGSFAITLPRHLPPGRYTVALSVLLDGNAAFQSAKLLRVRVGDAGAPG